MHCLRQLDVQDVVGDDGTFVECNVHKGSCLCGGDEFFDGAGSAMCGDKWAA